MTNQRLTYGEIHICLTCEHHEFCRMAQVIEGAAIIGAPCGIGYGVAIPFNFGEDFSPTMQIPDIAGKEGFEDDLPVLAGIRMCRRHSSGDPKLTMGYLD